jgi:hypothetical protein
METRRLRNQVKKESLPTNGHWTELWLTPKRSSYMVVRDK